MVARAIRVGHLFKQKVFVAPADLLYQANSNSLAQWAA